MAIGSDDNLYMLFCRDKSTGGGYEIAKLSSGEREVIAEGTWLPYDDIYSVMGCGNNQYEIFMKGSYGVYGFNAEKQQVELISFLRLDEFQFTKSCFLEGKRLLILGMNLSRDNTEMIDKIKISEIMLDE